VGSGECFVLRRHKYRSRVTWSAQGSNADDTEAGELELLMRAAELTSSILGFVSISSCCARVAQETTD